MTVTRERLMVAADAFPLDEAHRVVADLMTPSRRRYQLDIAVTAIAGWLAFALLVVADSPLIRVAAWAAATWLLYRAALFIHEVVHLRAAGDVAAVTRVWSPLVGYPLLIPTFLYACHNEHHSKRSYGTVGDAEYLPFARLPRAEMVRVLVLSPLTCLYGPLRFGVVPPLAWVSSRVRAWSWRHASAIKLDLAYEGHPPRSPRQQRSWVRQEGIAWAVVWGSLASAVLGVLPWTALAWWLVVVAGVVLLNSVRLLGAHRYQATDDQEATLMAQLIDTITVARHPIVGCFWGPVGLRLHALHHLFPSLPYYAMREAHGRLLDQLPSGSAYELTQERSLTAALLRLWRAPRDPDDVRTAS